MKYLEFLTSEGAQIATVHVDPMGNLKVSYLDQAYRAKLDPIITDEASAGLTFTLDEVNRNSPDHQATVMTPHSPTDPLFLDGLAHGFEIIGPVIINGHEIITRVIEQ